MIVINIIAYHNIKQSLSIQQYHHYHNIHFIKQTNHLVTQPHHRYDNNNNNNKLFAMNTNTNNLNNDQSIKTSSSFTTNLQQLTTTTTTMNQFIINNNIKPSKSLPKIIVLLPSKDTLSYFKRKPSGTLVPWYDIFMKISNKLGIITS